MGWVSERLTRGLRAALQIRSTGWVDLLIGTGVLWRRTAACEWPATRVSVDRHLDGIRSSARYLATGRQRSMFEFCSYCSLVLHCGTGHSGRGDCCLGCVSDETPAAPAPATAGSRDGRHDSRWRGNRLAGQRVHDHCCPAGLPASCVRPRWTRSFRAFGTGSAVRFSEDVQQDSPVHDPVQQGHRQRSVAEVLTPGIEFDVGPQRCR